VSDGIVEDAAEIFNPILASNAVNVFVGLGLPWTIRTIYDWQNLEGESLDLGVKETAKIAWVTFTFLILSILMLLCLGVRRLCCVAELGGKFSACCTMFFFLLWLLFVGLNVGEAYSPNYDMISAVE
jgi:magnesium/proton exchanger